MRDISIVACVRDIFAKFRLKRVKFAQISLTPTRYLSKDQVRVRTLGDQVERHIVWTGLKKGTFGVT